MQLSWSSRSLVSAALLVALAGVTPAWADRLDELARAAGDPSWKVRLQAISVLSRLRDARARPTLERALSDPNETVRSLAAQGLGDLGDASSIALLERARRDPSPLVRDRASAALERLHPSELTGAAPAPSAMAPGMLHVEVGGIGLKAKASPELKQTFRAFLERELMHTPGVTLEGKPVSGFLVDGAITSLEYRTAGPYTEISVEVSFIVGKLPSKAMVMMTSGGATVQGPRTLRPQQSMALERDALEGAVKGAHENLVAFLKTQPQMQTAGRALHR